MKHTQHKEQKMHAEKCVEFHVPQEKKDYFSNSDNLELLSSLEKEKTPGDISQKYVLEGLQIQPSQDW